MRFILTIAVMITASSVAQANPKDTKDVEPTWQWITECANTVNNKRYVSNKSWDSPAMYSFTNYVKFYDKPTGTKYTLFNLGPNVLCKTMNRTYYNNLK